MLVGVFRLDVYVVPAPIAVVPMLVGVFRRNKLRLLAGFYQIFQVSSGELIPLLLTLASQLQSLLVG